MDYSPPLIKSPFTDFAFVIAPHYQQGIPNTLCAQFERKFVDCMEAYGRNKAFVRCADIAFDMHECRLQTFQVLRAQEMYNERMRQYRAGKLDKPFEENPPLDSYLYSA